MVIIIILHILRKTSSFEEVVKVFWFIFTLIQLYQLVILKIKSAVLLSQCHTRHNL